MTVNAASKSTLGLLIILVGAWFGIPLLHDQLPFEVQSLHNYRISEFDYLERNRGGLSVHIIPLAFWVAVIAGSVDVIINQERGLSILKAFFPLIIISLLLALMTLGKGFGLWIFWLVLQVSVIVGMYWTYQRFADSNCHSGFSILGLIRSPMTFLSGHIIDRIVVAVVIGLLLALFAAQMILTGMHLYEYWSIYEAEFRAWLGIG